MAKERHNKHRLYCPHCGTFMTVRNSVAMSKTLRQGLVDCTNDACNFRGQFWFEIASTVAPSDMPDPDVNIKPTPFLQARMAKQYTDRHQLDMLRDAANDENPT